MSEEVQQRSCGEPGCKGSCHWVIINDKRKELFKGVYLSKADVKTTYEFHNLSKDWRIEHRNH